MSIYLADTIEHLQKVSIDDDVILASHIKEYGGALSPTFALSIAALERQRGAKYILLRDEPLRPSDVQWSAVLQRVGDIEKAIAPRYTALPKLIVPVPMHPPLSGEASKGGCGCTLKVMQTNTSKMQLWADPTVYLLDCAEWSKLPKYYAGICWPLVGLTESEQLAAAGKVKELYAETELPIIVIPYKRTKLSEQVITSLQHDAIRILQYPGPVCNYASRGSVLPWQEYELVTNLFSLPLKESA